MVFVGISQWCLLFVFIIKTNTTLVDKFICVAFFARPAAREQTHQRRALTSRIVNFRLKIQKLNQAIKYHI